MEGTFPTLCEKTRQERAGWNQSGNQPLGRSALSRAGQGGRGGGGWRGRLSDQRAPPKQAAREGGLVLSLRT